MEVNIEHGEGGEEGETDRLVGLLPDANRLVVRTGNDEVRPLTDGKRPDLAGVTSKLLDALELHAEERRQQSAPLSGARMEKREGASELDAPCRRPST